MHFANNQSNKIENIPMSMMTVSEKTDLDAWHPDYFIYFKAL